jgi:hypothetical protein
LGDRSASRAREILKSYEAPPPPDTAVAELEAILQRTERRVRQTI